MATVQIHLATPETTSSDFKGFGTTEDAAEVVLGVLCKQGRQCHPRFDWHVQHSDPATRAARLAHGERDFKRLTGGNRPQARK